MGKDEKVLLAKFEEIEKWLAEMKARAMRRDEELEKIQRQIAHAASVVRANQAQAESNPTTEKLIDKLRETT